MNNMNKNPNNPFLHEYHGEDDDDDEDDYGDSDYNEYEHDDEHHTIPIHSLKLNKNTMNDLMKWENIRKAQYERSNDHENYFSEIDKSMDGFNVTANYFGKTVVVK